MEAQNLVTLPIVLALEPVVGDIAVRGSLTRDEAAELAELVAADLQALVPAVSEARLALVGALFDQAELLRPGFPVWAALDEMARRVPRGHLDNVVAFGSHDGQMPMPELQPSTLFADGPMRLMPLTLLAPEALAATLSEQLEIHLVGRGEAGARTADWLMRTLGIRLEHVRYLSRNDLLAMACVQYEHVNLAPLWTLLEAALLSPYRDEATMSVRGLNLNYTAGKVMAASPSHWLAQQPVSLRADRDQARHAFAGIVFELRQYAALLEAHALPLQLQQEPGRETEQGNGYLLETLARVDGMGSPPEMFAHEAPGLGVVVITVVQRSGDGSRLLAHAYPLQPQALGPLVALLAERYGIAPDLHALGQILLDENGTLGVPAVTLH